MAARPRDDALSLEPSGRRPSGLAALRRVVTDHLRRSVTGPAAAPPLAIDDDAAFRDHATWLTARNMRAGCAAIVAASLLAWPFDEAVFGEIPGVVSEIAGTRVVHVGLGVLTYLLLSTPLRRRPLVVASPTAVVSTGLLGVLAGRLGGLDAPWMHIFCWTVLFGAIVVVPLRARALFTIVLPLSLFAGFLSARRHEIGRAMLLPILAFVTVLTIGTIAFSHAFFVLLRRDFSRARAERRAAHALADLNETLELRVREQTEELRLLAEHLEHAREHERTRISHELHDELGQELTAMRYAISVLKQRFDRDPASARGAIEQLDGLLQRTTATMRNLVSELRPRILDELGLDAGIEWLVRRTEERTGLACHLSLPGDELAPDVEISTAAFRVIQEALTNVSRHARASRVDIEIGAGAGELCVLVRDDGIGMPEHPPRPRPGKGGLGLIGMRERAEALGGRMKIDSAPGRGTTLRVSFPLQRRQHRIDEEAHR